MIQYMSDSLSAVSYTHLDVYKRQFFVGPHRMHFIKLVSDAGERIDQSKITELFALQEDKICGYIDTVSYTHLCQSIKPSLEKIKVYARGWLNYYGIASIKNNIDDINGWLYHRIRMCIWKQWKKPRTKYKNLVKLGIPEHYASTIANSRRKYWYISNNKAVIWALNKERLINSGYYDLATAYQSVHVNY